jgi:hypothetical protein
MAGSIEPVGGPWLSPEQVAKKLGLSLETISTWRTQGRGPPWVFAGDDVWYNEADFTRWFEEMTGGHTR